MFNIKDIDEMVPNVEESATAEKDNVKIGVIVDCDLLNVREKPSLKSKVKCTIARESELVVDEQASTKDFYKVCLASGIDGYCMKKYVSIQ